MSKRDFHVSINTPISAKEAFKKIAQVGEWWLTSFKGKALKVNDTFSVIMGDHGHANFKIIEAIPAKKVVWLVTDSYMNSYKDKGEWTNTKIVFELTETKGKTQVDFTHVGLNESMECYTDCEWGWNHYMNGSLPKLFKLGKGTPYKGPYTELENESKDFSYKLTVSASPKYAMKCIGEVGKWWAEDFRGKAVKENDKFSVHFGDTFVDFKISEVIPGKKVVWLVTNCNLHWIKNKREWKNTEVIYTLTKKGEKTIIDFVHKGMTPEFECYKNCEEGWTGHLKNSLKSLINKGKGFPE